MNGLIIINKPKEFTSNDAVQKMRKILNTKKVGHTGTLDPNATGVLPILVGKGTKLSKYLIEHNKTYIGVIKLGRRTDTGDVKGNTIEEKEVNTSMLTKENINNILKTFMGKQKQIPPIYSSIKKDGKKLYEYARAGIEVEIDPRDIEIYNIQLIEINLDESKITYEVECSKGTYIRVLSEDIAKKLSTVRIFRRTYKNKSKWIYARKCKYIWRARKRQRKHRK